MIFVVYIASLIISLISIKTVLFSSYCYNEYTVQKYTRIKSNITPITLLILGILLIITILGVFKIGFGADLIYSLSESEFVAEHQIAQIPIGMLGLLVQGFGTLYYIISFIISCILVIITSFSYKNYVAFKISGQVKGYRKVLQVIFIIIQMLIFVLAFI